MKYAVTLVVMAALLSGPASAQAQAPAPATFPIQYVIVIVKENHTFDNYFGQFPGADGARTVPIRGTTQPPPHAADRTTEITHSFSWARTAHDRGRMDRFAEVPGAVVGDFPLAFAQYREEDIPAYWTYARQFVLFDRYFTSVMGPSAPNHLFLVAASSAGTISNPRRTGGQPACAAPGAIMDLLTPSGKREPIRACLDIPTLPDLLTPRGITWRGYGYWAMGILHRLYDDTAMRRHLVAEGEFLQDVRNHTLPAVSWIAPSRDEHPPNSICDGENGAVQLVNAVMSSPYWSSSLILITWDDWGGWYDHLPPPQVDPLGLGFRVPTLVISPYAKRGQVSHRQTEHTSVVRTIETLFGLTSLSERDRRANDLLDALDVAQPPRPPRVLQTRPCP